MPPCGDTPGARPPGLIASWLQLLSLLSLAGILILTAVVRGLIKIVRQRTFLFARSLLMTRKTVILAVFFLLLAIPGCSNSPSSETKSLDLPGGRHYTGEIKDGKPNGHGTLTADADNRYEGDFVDGRIEGRGKLYLPDGSVYEGEFKKNLINGYGVIVAKDGTRYEGQWKDGKMHGKGTFTAADGTRKSGYFEFGKYVGKEAPQVGKMMEAEDTPDWGKNK